MKYLKSVVLIIFLCLVLKPNFASATTVTPLVSANTKADTWVEKANMPFGIREFGITEVGGKIYIFGGYSNNGKDNVYNNKVISYDPTTDKWSEVADMATQNRTPQRCGAITVNGKVYVIGSTGYSGNIGLVEEFDPLTKTWATKAPMLTPRMFTGAAVINNKIYIVGGDSSILEEYDPSTNTWSRKADMPTPRLAPSVIAVNGVLYAIGGDSPNHTTRLANVEVYDPKTNTWSKKTEMPTGAAGTQIATLYGKIYVMGGVEPKDYSSNMNEYDPVTDKWTKRKNMPTIRIGGGAISVNGKIYVMGGETPVGHHFPILEEYTPSNVPTQIALTAIGEEQTVNLNWSAADVATGYEVKRSTTTRGPYTTIASNVQGTTFADKDVENGKTYYYVVTVNTSSGENGTSNEAFATPQSDSTPNPEPPGDRAVLTITLTNGIEKEFDLSIEEVNAFLKWYDTKDADSGPAKFAIDKHNNNKGPFAKRTEYVIFDKILTFEVSEYSAKK
ncbi:kelch repeat-containing protein [Paenibacillus sp. FSL L8-0436]|uniref:Kelch repeat-containing protein n=1 Tax=Paenibacillus sp. FSL L8-0436 TaxID=2954686 RepID=UPI0031594221